MPETCTCELEGNAPRSTSTLAKLIGDPSRFDCQRCGATLQQSASGWQRTEACSCVLVRGTWDYGDYPRPKSYETLAELRREEVDELTQRTTYQCRKCGAKLEKVEEDHTATTWDRSVP